MLEVPLLELTVAPVPDDQVHLQIIHFGNEDEGWKWGMFSELLPHAVVLQIAAHQPPHHSGSPDHLYWGLSSSGLFTTKSAYQMLACTESPHTGRTWNLIWKWIGPQRIRNFMWLAVQDRLMTNVERARRHLGSSEMCELCGVGRETTLHVLRDCWFAKRLWYNLLTNDNHTDFFSLGLEEWFKVNLRSEGSAEGVNRWECVFGVATWRLWAWRNHFTFQKCHWHGNKVEDVLCRVREISHSTERLGQFTLSGKLKTHRLIGWEPPTEGWVKNCCVE